MAKFEIHEVRTVVYTVEVPDSVSIEAIQTAGLDSANFQARGSGEKCIADSSELELLEVYPCRADDDEPADVQLDEQLNDRWPPYEQPAHVFPRLSC